MSTSVITNRITDSSGTALANVQVTCVLRPRPAFVTATGVELSSILSTTTDSNGDWSLTLTETADITPSASYYEITERIPERYGGLVTHRIQVGANGATVLASLVSTPPASAAANTYLTQEAADLRYVQAPGSFAVVGNIADSRPSDASAAGVLSTYARGDHKHSRERDAGTTVQRAALSGVELYKGRRYYDTDLGSLLVYYGATTGWQKPWGLPWGVQGYAEVTANQTGITTLVDLTNLTTTFTAVANRRYRIRGRIEFNSSVADGVCQFIIADSANVVYTRYTGSAYLSSHTIFAETIESPAAGAVTFKLRLERTTGTGTYQMSGSATAPSFILVEDIGSLTTPPAA